MTYLTPPEAAAELRCRESKILGWIRAGRLPAVNLSEGLRPRYRISRAALDDFLTALAVVPASRPVRRQRRETTETYV
ncbi:MAG: helix-turn-helix domain-containing protein [Planctomycetota bacterium]|nr:helix-turn-helix domain-containing protein [Planctomycetota bacterium]